ncbi:hypothetical protein Hanom_Chr02g00123651 [Helianthus anomalus]
MTYNPTCDNLLHVPHWNLVQGSHMDNLDNYHELYSISFPPTKWLYQKNRDRFHLLDDHVRPGVNFFAPNRARVAVNG